MKEDKKHFFDFIIANPELLYQSCASIDLKKFFPIPTSRNILSYLMTNIETYDDFGCNIKVGVKSRIIFNNI